MKDTLLGLLWMVVLFIIYKIGTALGFGVLWTFGFIIAMIALWALLKAVVRRMSS